MGRRILGQRHADTDLATQRSEGVNEAHARLWLDGRRQNLAHFGLGAVPMKSGLHPQRTMHVDGLRIPFSPLQIVSINGGQRWVRPQSIQKTQLSASQGLSKTTPDD